MAASDKNRLTETCADGEPSPHQIWTDYRRNGGTRPRLRDSLARTIHVKGADSVPEDYSKAILCENTAGEKILDMAVRELLAKTKSGEGAIQKQGRGMLPMFCVSSYTGDFPNSAFQLARKCNEQRLHSELHDLDPSQLDDFAEETDLGGANLQKGKEPQRGAKARKRLAEAVAHFLRAFDDDQADNQPKVKVLQFLKDRPKAEDTLKDIEAALKRDLRFLRRSFRQREAGVPADELEGGGRAGLFTQKNAPGSPQRRFRLRVGP